MSLQLVVQGQWPPPTDTVVENGAGNKLQTYQLNIPRLEFGIGEAARNLKENPGNIRPTEARHKFRA